MQMKTSLARMPHLGLRLQLTFALGLLAALVIAVTLSALLGVRHLHATARQAVAMDSRLSRLSSEIAIQTLLCRRYEKDLFLNLADAKARAGYLAQWNRAYDDLGVAIGAFAAIATAPDDTEQVATWRAQWKSYRSAFVQVQQAIDDGIIKTPEGANRALAPFKDAIRILTDTATTVAQRNAERAEQAEVTLEQEASLVTWRILGFGALAALLALGWSLLFPAQLMRPIAALGVATNRLAAGDLMARVGLDRADELGQLGRSFDVMGATIQQRTRELETQVVATETARAQAEAARAEAAARLATIEQQRAVIREMSTPILPLAKTALIMPLVGALDTARLRLLQGQALQAIERSSVRHLILDITAVPLIDTHVAGGLLQVIQAARLLGTEVVLVGIRPEIAQTVANLGVNLVNVTTRSTLEDGIAYALRD
jgi:rsbT co-antagonist protein RsbR